MSPTKKAKQKPVPACLGDHVRDAIDKYFADLEGETPTDLYNLVIEQIENPLFESVLNNSRGNLTKASKILGINRATLRNRLKKYGLDK